MKCHNDTRENQLFYLHTHVLYSEPAGRVPGIWWLIRWWAGEHTPECHQTSGIGTRNPEISCHQKDVCPLGTTSRAHFVISSWDSESQETRKGQGLAGPSSYCPAQVSTLLPRQTALHLWSCLGPLCCFWSTSPVLGSCWPFTVWSSLWTIGRYNHQVLHMPWMHWSNCQTLMN